MFLENIIFALLVLTAFTGFGWTVQRMVRKLLRGRPTGRQWSEWGSRVGDVISYFFLQRSVIWKWPSWHHLLIFWGFLIIVVGTIEILINGIFPAFSFQLFGNGFNAAFKAILDVTNFIVLLIILYAFFRRIVLRPNLIPMSLDAGLILGMIALLCLSHFISHGFHFPVKASGSAELVAAIGGPPGDPGYMPVSAMFGRFAEGLSLNAAHAIATVNYWLHVLILLFFLNYIPYSKHLHLLGALPNILLRRRTQQGILPKLDLEDEDQWGAGRYEQFSWKTLLDSYACTECARCTNSCPAYATEKPLSPMHLMHDIKDEMNARGEGLIKLRKGVNTSGYEDAGGIAPDDREKAILEQLDQAPSLIGERIKDETLWACTMCGACEETCPVFIEHPLAILQMRTHLVLAEGRMPGELGRMFRGLENNANPWGFGADNRMEWAEDMELPIMAEKGEAEYLVWIGCAGCFDPEGQKTSRAWLALLKQAGVDFAVLGKEEGCTGDAARRAGNEYLFQTLAEQNIELFQQYKVKKILTACPHCLHSFKHEYPQFGGNYEVQHHAQFLQQLLNEGKLQRNENSHEGAITFHDPCYLGRWNNEYDSPREVIAQTAGGLTEMPRTRNESFCCGAGGAQMWMEETGERINVNRATEAVNTGARTIATACPFCKVMISDGIKALDKEEEVQVLDIAQLFENKQMSE